MAEQKDFLDASNPASPFSIPANKTAFFMMDFHTFIVGSMSGGAQKAMETANAMREWARSQNMLIIHCLLDLKVDMPPQLKLAAQGAQIQQLMNSQGPEFHAEAPAVRAGPDEYIFWRPLGCISALSSYGLSAFLQRHGIESVILSGVATSGVVLDTAKGMSESGKVVTLIEDACADSEPETHEFIMKKLFFRQCHFATKDTFVDAWK